MVRTYAQNTQKNIVKSKALAACVLKKKKKKTYGNLQRAYGINEHV